MDASEILAKFAAKHKLNEEDQLDYCLRYLCHIKTGKDFDDFLYRAWADEIHDADAELGFGE